MSKPSRRKRERRRKRDRKKAERGPGYRRRVAAIDRFPRFEIDAGSAPAALVDVVTRTLLKVAAEHEQIFPDTLVELYQLARRLGFRAVFDLFASRGVSHWGWVNLLSLPGQALHLLLPEDVVTRYFPFHAVRILAGPPSGNAFTVKFVSLRSTKTAFGTAYYSPHRPTLQVGDRRVVVAFYRHAIERIRERTVVDWRSYLGTADAFAFLYDCIYFEPWASDQAPGFTFFESCNRPFFTWDYAVGILGEPITLEHPHYRVGYCPAVEADGFLVAKTLLVPGMQGTPEHAWFLNSSAPSPSVRRKLHERAALLTKAKLVETLDFSLLREFHHGGIPQVVNIEQQTIHHGGYCS